MLGFCVRRITGIIDMNVGIDFGTTNSVLAVARKNGGIAVARHGANRESGNFRSILCFARQGSGPGANLMVKAGPGAIAAYLEHGSDCRLIQSVKSMAANPNFSSTYIFGRKYTIEDLIALILQDLRSSAEADLGPLGPKVTAGRPVRFAGQIVDEKLALKRLEDAFALAGFPEIDFVAEPMAAAYKFAASVDRPQICLIADFGGGTSDFSLVRFAPAKNGTAMKTLATSGVGLAGDRFDYRIIENAVCPALGLGSTYVSMGKRLPIPVHYYTRFQRWSDLSFLRAPEILRELRGLRRMADDPGALDRFLYIIEEELGFDLYRAVSEVKSALSSGDSARLEFSHGPVRIDRLINRADFESWIAGDLQAIDAEISSLFENGAISPGEVDHVFMTGGTSFVPAVRQLMAQCFPEAQFSAEDEFVSVGAGLALHAREHSETVESAA